MVRWQDGLGGWHDVEGWRGAIEGERVLWRVDEVDLNTGPFRWVVYADDETLGVSEPFYMPEVDGEVVYVAVTIEP